MTEGAAAGAGGAGAGGAGAGGAGAGGAGAGGAGAGGAGAGGAGAGGSESLGDASSHFISEAQGEPAGAGRYVNLDSLSPVEFVPGLGFRPVLGQRAMTNFVSFEPGAVAPRHVHEEEQIVIILDGEMVFDLDGDVRTMRKGDVAVIPAWVPHGAWTVDTHCEEVDVFCPPRQSLLKLAEAQASAEPGGASGSAPDAAADESTDVA